MSNSEVKRKDDLRREKWSSVSCTISEAFRDFLNISNNLFSGCPGLGLSPVWLKLEVLIVYLTTTYSCPLSGWVSESSQSLRHLDFGGNYFSRGDPIRGMAGLNQLKLEIPGNISQTMQLKPGEIPVVLCTQRNSPILNTFSSTNSMAKSESIAELPPNLQALQLWRNNITGFIPQKLRGRNGRAQSCSISPTKNSLARYQKSLCYGKTENLEFCLTISCLGALPDE
nr:leucine-rich repeat receptor-like serine/threonine-protein kinase BAM3 [Ipomoea batatas]